MDAMTFLQSVQGVNQLAKSGSADRPIRLATIDSAYEPDYDTGAGLLPKVTFDGESTMSGKRYPFMSGYVPYPDDRVLMLPVGSAYVIIGSVNNVVGAGFGQVAADDYSILRLGPNSYFVTDSSVTTAVINGNSIHPNADGISGQAMSAGANSITATTYADMAGPVSAISNWTKRETATRVRVSVDHTWYSNNLNTGPYVGARINGTDYDIMRWSGALTPNARQLISGTRYISGIPAGTYTVQLRWKCAPSATGTLSRDTNDWSSAEVMEVD